MILAHWGDLLRVVVMGVAGYASVVAVLRLTGKRTLSKMNAFDFIITIALGSTLATTLLSKQVTLAEGVLALALLCVLQYVITFASVRSSAFKALVKAEPTLLLRDGAFLREAMRRERVTEDEIFGAVRAQGVGDIAEVAGVVLETDGSLSVLRSAGSTSAVLPTAG